MKEKNIKNFIQIIYSTAKKVSLRKIEKLLDSSNRSSQKEYCGTASVNREAVSINTAQLYIEININGKTGNTMINSDITENFMTKKYTESKKYLIQDK